MSTSPIGADKLIEDIEATLLARCGAAGEGGYLSRETVRWLKMWLEHLRIRDGAVFRRLIGKDQIGGPLNPGSIAPIFKRVAQWIEMPERFVGGVSRHSTRVGETQDLAALDIDLAAITQAGGRKSTRMPLQYAERINAATTTASATITGGARRDVGRADFRLAPVVTRPFLTVPNDSHKRPLGTV
jgi:hypothetical protein